MSSPVSLLDFTFAGIGERLAVDGVNPRHARPLWGALHRELSVDVENRDDFPAPLRAWLADHFGHDVTLDRPEITATTASDDGLTRKLLLRLDDGAEIETVLMGYRGRTTVCLSTQVGCAMGCVFCATGQMGFTRHLRPGEIVAQVHHARRLLRSLGQNGPRNLVLMGMGEPLHNYDAVLRALDIISDTGGLNIGPGRISVSTVGLVPAIRRFTAERQPYQLAVSLHAATDEERSALLPINVRWPLEELLAACREHAATTGRRLFFGWTLIEGKNDTPSDARRVADLLAGLDAHVNLIPLNPTAGYAGRTTGLAAARTFQTVLRTAGLACTIRERRGIDVAAGCGQLRATVV